ncbi:hypothetical protein MML48_2g00016978 [Holotrichia oblita]|uniref:Uncharacterized protein n=1 Tax=Holotrichia oblita TaxID=644536 RepID=A0ACB9TML2_HOLOL|nr:hypothetical protein MML48_2g00016978 [Holotrichia oblita]
MGNILKNSVKNIEIMLDDTGIQDLTETVEHFQEWQWFPNVIGAIDGTHIPITAPAKYQTTYCNRHHYHSIILQVVCKADYTFTDMFAGYPGSVHDARVFRNSELGQRCENYPESLFPNDTHLLGDSAYKNTSYLLAPYYTILFLNSSNFNCIKADNPKIGLIGERELVEVKCLYKLHKENKNLGEAIAMDKQLCIEMINGQLRLKRSHNYYYQVQGQLNIAKKDKCL